MIQEYHLIFEVIRVKPSYKLLGIYLDRRNLPECKPTITECLFFDDIQCITESYSLFELASKTRKVFGSELLSYESFLDITKQIDNIKGCEQIVIVLDFISRGLVANKLYMRRLLQLFQLLTEKYSAIEFSFACKPEGIVMYTNILQMVYVNMLPSN